MGKELPKTFYVRFIGSQQEVNNFVNNEDGSDSGLVKQVYLSKEQAEEGAQSGEYLLLFRETGLFKVFKDTRELPVLSTMSSCKMVFING